MVSFATDFSNCDRTAHCALVDFDTFLNKLHSSQEMVVSKTPCNWGWGATPQVPILLGRNSKKVCDELQNILLQLSRSGFEENKIFITFGEQQLQLFLKVKVRTTCENF